MRCRAGSLSPYRPGLLPLLSTDAMRRGKMAACRSGPPPRCTTCSQPVEPKGEVHL